MLLSGMDRVDLRRISVVISALTLSLLLTVNLCALLALTADVTVPVGQVAVLPCKVDINAQYQVMWTDASGTILTLGTEVQTTDHRFSVRQLYRNEWDLQIESVRTQDQGKYSCILTVGGSVHTTKDVLLHIHVPPSIVVKSTDISVETGSDVTLECLAKGTPDPTIVWYLHRKVEPSRMVTLDASGGAEGKWRLLAVNSSMAGEYECRADNGVQPPTAARIRLDVNSAPTVNVPYRLVRQRLGSDTLLQCIVNANPPAESYWELGGERVTSHTNMEKYLTYRDEVGEYKTALGLLVRDLSEADCSMYRCVASNHLGTAEAVLSLSAWHMYTTTTREGHSTIIYCPLDKGQDDPMAEITWYFRSTIILGPGASKSSKYQLAGRTGLNIAAVTLDDGGEYRCDVTGQQDNRYVHLTVLGTSTQCSNAAGSEQVISGRTIRLTCSLAYTGPTPQWRVTWSSANGWKYQGLARVDATPNSQGHTLMHSDLIVQATEKMTGNFRCDVTCDDIGCSTYNVAPCESGIHVLAAGLGSCDSASAQASTTTITLLAIFMCIAAILFVTSVFCIVRLYRRKMADLPTQLPSAGSRRSSATVQTKCFRQSVLPVDVVVVGSSDLKKTAAE